MSWLKPKDAQESLVILGQVAAACRDLGGPLCSHLFKMVASEDYRSLVQYDIDYEYGWSINDIVYARQILGLYQKAEYLELGIDRQDAAAVRFVESERMCLATNRRLKLTAISPHLVDSDIHQVLSLAQWKIGSMLSDFPELDELAFEFGPGANTNVKGRVACPRAKLSAGLECSTDLAPTVGAFLSETPHWTALHSHFESEDSYRVNVSVVPGKVIFVPKNAKTDRTIVVEPLLNSFYQKGVGTYFKKVLSRSGVDLTDQTKNQRMAARGSIDGSLATIDLSMASDCMASELVWSLFPMRWAELLSSLRTSEVLVPPAVSRLVDVDAGLVTKPIGGVLRLEKFSSMGNGYTFELESMIFYALAYSVCRTLGLRQKDISIYGDDIIVPVPAVPLLRKVLEHCGFAFNTAKSFASGPFRESCGADYLNGFDIRPFYQKTPVSERTLFTMHNWFVRSGEYQLAELTASLCNPTYAIYGPDGFGDGHLVGTFELRKNRRITREGWDGGYFDTYSLKSRSFHKPLPGDAVLPVYSVYTRSGELGPTDPDVVRGSAGYAKISIYTLGRSIFSRKD